MLFWYGWGLGIDDALQVSRCRRSRHNKSCLHTPHLSAVGEPHPFRIRKSTMNRLENSILLPYIAKYWSHLNRHKHSELQRKNKRVYHRCFDGGRRAILAIFLGITGSVLSIKLCHGAQRSKLRGHLRTTTIMPLVSAFSQHLFAL